MRRALDLYGGKRIGTDSSARPVTWDTIADEHIKLYKSLIR
jgi:hypothetical protein